MVLFIKKFLTEAQASPAEEIACFNMDFFGLESKFWVAIDKKIFYLRKN
jgi:hypothetical protein